MKLAHAGQLLKDILQFARENKVWWMVPLTIVLLLGGLLVIAGQGATPFIYTLF